MNKMLSWAIVLAAAFLAGAPAQTSAATTRIDIDPKQTGAVISPLLFGHNLEVTRRALWSGLSAEMVANRKFAAVNKDKTMPLRWYAIGDGAATLDAKEAYAGKQSVRVEVKTAGEACGIGQGRKVLKPGAETLVLRKGASYAVRVWVKTPADRNVRILLAKDDGSRPILNQEFPAKAGDWQLLTAACEARETADNVRLEITSKDAGVFWIGAVSVQPADAFHGMRRDVIERLKELKPGCLRFPGGCYAEFYRWQDGLMDVDQRPPIGPTGLEFLLRDSDDVDMQEIGIDEFIALCREVGSEPALTIRLSETAPEDGAAWVEYCNGSAETKWGKLRAERGQPEPYGVKTWFVGNELYYFGRGGMNAPANCARQTRLFCEAIRKVDPTVSLVGCTDLVGGNINMGWNKPLLDQAGELITHVSYHDYLGTPGDLAAYAALAAGRLRPTLERARRELNRPVILDEWNTNWGQRGSVGMGFCVAGVLNLLCREGADLGVRQAYFFQPITEGAIRVTPLGAELAPAGKVFSAFKGHQGKRVVKLSGVPANPDLDVCVSTAEDGRSLFATLINRSATEEQTVALAVKNLGGKPKATASFLVAKEPAPGVPAFEERREQIDATAEGATVKVPPYGIAIVEITAK